MNTTVIYHRADYDGIFCLEIARKFLPPDTQFIGWDYGDPHVKAPEEGTIYILDLSPECLDASQIQGTFWSRIIWIDHHKSAIERFENHPPIAGYRIDGVAACRLAWQFFAAGKHAGKGTCGGNPDLPTKEQYKERRVSEPESVRLAGEYDIWDHAISSYADVAFQFGLDAQEILNWTLLLHADTPGERETWRIVGDGLAAQRCYAKRDAEVMKSRSFVTQFEGLTFLCLNTARCNSNTFAGRDVPETGHAGLLAFYWTGRDFSVSLYHAKHRTELDLSEIAKRHGGGGHRGACGFRAKWLPFVTDGTEMRLG